MVFPSFKMDFVTEDCKPGGEGKQDFQRAPCRGVVAKRGPAVGPEKDTIATDSQEAFQKKEKESSQDTGVLAEKDH